MTHVISLMCLSLYWVGRSWFSPNRLAPARGDVDRFWRRYRCPGGFSPGATR